MKLILVSLMVIFASPAFAQGFIKPEEEEFIDHKSVGTIEVVMMEDFLNNSFSPAVVVAIENDMALVKRDGAFALLVPYRLYDSISENPFVVFANTCQSQCAGSAAGGAITGAVGGAVGGAQAGASIAGPQGAIGGLVIGGIAGGIGGGISGFEMCKIATGCSKKLNDAKGSN